MSRFDRTGRKVPAGTSDPASRVAATARTPQKKSGGGTLLGIFIGLIGGMLIAFGVVWYLNKSPSPFQDKYEGAAKAEKQKPVAGTSAPGAAQAPVPLPGKPGGKPADGRFQFYDLLEGKSPATPGTAARPAPAAAAATPPQAAETKSGAVEILYLQVGAFQKAADADNLKAKLALTGLEASVQEVSIPDKGIMHRVRVGPFRDAKDMDRARAQLSQYGVQGAVIKQKE